MRLLEPQMLKRFEEYVHSPYFNKHERVRLLADILIAEAPDYKEEALSREVLSRRIFGKGPMEYQKLSDLFTYLYRLFEGFLAQRTFDENVFDREYALLKKFREKGMGKQFESLFNSPIELKDVTAEDKAWYSFNRYKEGDVYFSAKDSRSKDKNIEKKIMALDAFFLSAKLRACCEMLNRQNIVNEKYQIDFFEETLRMAEAYAETEHPAVEILVYYRILLSIKYPDEEQHYKSLRDLLEQFDTQMFSEEVRAMYDFAQNYCIKKINTGKPEYLAEILRLYKGLLQNGLILVNGELSQWDYKNIVTVGCRLKEFDWTGEFIVRFKDNLPAVDKENAYAYNLASLYYSQQNHDKAMKLLQEVQFTDVYYGLGARSLLLKIYYEANELDPLYSLFDSFKTYLRRNELISEYQFRAHMNLVRFTKKLTDLKIRSISSRKDTLIKDVAKLKGKMNVAGEITNSSWLMQMIDQLLPEKTGVELAGK